MKQLYSQSFRVIKQNVNRKHIETATHGSNCFMLQDRIAQLELDLEDERQNGDQLMDRIDRGREQV